MFIHRRPGTGIQLDQTGGYRPSQPSLKYPFRPVTPPRVDNKDQPWYGGMRFSGPAGQGSYDPITSDSFGNDMAHVSDIWKNLDNFWGQDKEGKI